MKTQYTITDIHSHVLYGIDDGAESLEESLEMLKAAASQGVRKVFCTSHRWSADAVKYDANFTLLSEGVKAEGIDIKLYKGMEILCARRYLAETVCDITDGSAKAMGGTDYVLIELLPYMPPDEIYLCINTIFEKTGKRVILAHVERYEGLYGEDMLLACLKELGCLFQVNAYSLVKETNEKIKGFARRLLSEGLVDFIGSDAHGIRHRPPEVISGAEYIYKSCDKAYADAVCFANAEKIFFK